MSADAHAFKEVLSRFASGVTVVTTMNAGSPHGLTVSAFTSVSVSPPRVLICLGNETDSKPLVESSGCFAVHVLGRDHVTFGQRFAKLIPGIDDPFAGLPYRLEKTGSPILSCCIAWLDCRVEATLGAGDHTIFVGAVEAAGPPDEGDPILYYRRGWRILDPGTVGG